MQLACEGHPQIATVTPGMQFVQNRPTVHPEPVLTTSTDFERTSVSIYGSVLHDGGVFRMWYQATSADWAGEPQGLGVGCVESDDGLSWRRPSYGVREVCGTRENHITDLRFSCPSVFIDSAAPDSMRYRAFGFAIPEPDEENSVKRRGYFTAHSSDGIHWNLDSDEPLYDGADVITSAWNPYTNSALVVLKRIQWVRNMPRRVHLTSQWTRESATEPISAFVPDDFDDVVAVSRGFNSADYYGVGLMPSPGVTVGFLWHFRHTLPLSSGIRQYGIFGRMDLSLMYQIQHRGKWLHFPGRADWLCADDVPEWGRHSICTAAFPIEVGDETRLYITGSPYRHGAYLDNSWNPEPKRTAMMMESGYANIGLVSWPTNRLLGFEAPLIETIELVPAGAASELVLNVRTARDGVVRVALVDGDDKIIDGFGYDDCQAISGDHRRVVVRWSGGRGLPHQLAKAQVEMTRGTLWAFEFAGQS